MATKRNPPGDETVPAVSPEGSGTTSLSDRLDRYSAARQRARYMLAHLRSQSSLLEGTPEGQSVRTAAAGLATCGEWLRFRNYYSVGDTRLVQAKFCKQHLLCPLCAIRRGAKSLDAYLTRWEVVHTRRDDLRLFLVTFTVRNGPHLQERFLHLQRSFQRLQHRRRDYFVRGRGFTEWAKAAGGVFSYELTNKGKGWHPHVHVIVAAQEAPDKYRLRSEWEGITKDSFMVDVRPILKDSTGYASGFMEVLKYAVKFSDLTEAQTMVAWLNLRGRRLLGSFGVFRGVQVPESLLDDPLEGLPYIDFLYRFVFGDYHLVTAEVCECENRD